LAEDECRLVCCLTGKISWLVFSSGQTSEYPIQAGRFGFYTCPASQRYTACASEDGSQILQFVFPNATLVALLGNDPFSTALTGSQTDAAPSGIVREINPSMNRIILSIREAFQQDDVTDLFLLAKALELLWMFCSSKVADLQPQISLQDRKAIQQALIILQDNLETPPPLGQLASQVGMSVSKLKILFPRVCGVPPYEYLRKMRMEKAMTLLTNGMANVTEAAIQVGYSSISHFAKAFQREFAISPSQARFRPAATEALTPDDPSLDEKRLSPPPV